MNSLLMSLASPPEGRQQKLYLKILIISFCVWHLILIKLVTIQVSYDTIKLNTHSSATTHAYIAKLLLLMFPEVWFIQKD